MKMCAGVFRLYGYAKYIIVTKFYLMSFPFLTVLLLSFTICIIYASGISSMFVIHTEYPLTLKIDVNKWLKGLVHIRRQTLHILKISRILSSYKTAIVNEGEGDAIALLGLIHHLKYLS